MTRYGRQGTVVVKDHGYRALVHASQTLNGVGIKVGIVADQPASSGNASLIDVASHHEFGAPRANIPERSFIRSTIDENRSEIGVRFARAEKAVVEGKMTPANALAQFIGRWLVERIRAKINKGPFAPLAPSTIARKGHDKPLIDTGLMRAAINFKITEARARGRRAS